MSTLWDRIQYRMLRSGSKVSLLIWINIIVYLFINIPATLEKFIFRTDYIDILSDKYLSLHAYLPTLIRTPWTLLTYMFMHAGILHILINMLWLYWMGQIFEEYLGTKRTVGLYIMGGLVGAFLFILFYNIPTLFSPQDLMSGSLVGASAGIMAIIVATGTLLPDYEVWLILIGPVKLKWIVLCLILLDFFGIVGFNAGGELSHLGGALFGFIYIKQVQRGNDMVAFFGKIFRKRQKLTVASRTTTKPVGNKPRQDEIDRILDKISQSGYDSLTKQEKEILFRASKDNES
jgi:membrane associated rhomboid family serine protease